MATVGRVTEITSQSEVSFDDAVQAAVGRASRTLRNVTGGWIKDLAVKVEDGKVVSYQVNVEITFVLDDED